ncbi:MAG: cytochrome P450, partial [Vicinamibacterales bacterium]
MAAEAIAERPVPGPTGPRWRRLLEAHRDLLGYLGRMVETYGGLVCLRPGRTYLAVHPDYARHVLQGNHLNYVKGPVFRRVIGPLIGEGLLAVDGEDWRRQRRRAQPHFLRKEHPAYVPMVTPCVEALCTQFDALALAGEPVNFNQLMDRLAVAANVRMMCSGDADEDVDRLVSAFVETGHSLNPVSGFLPVRLPAFVPTPKRLRFRRAVDGVDRIIYRLIDHRRRHSNGQHDLLSGLIEHREGEGGGDRRLRDEIMTMLHAGFETVSDQLVWHFVALDAQPHIASKVREEAVRVSAGRVPTLEELGQLAYLHRVQQEVMRLYPAAWGYFRQALADDSIDGYRIPAGALVLLVPYLTHRLPSIWSRPDEFEPDRFTPEAVAARHEFAFFPFGAGPRHCIGGEFAALLIAMTVATVIQRFRLEVLPGQHVRA